MLLFRSEEHVARWCRIWSIPRGAVFTLEQGWTLAKAWYGDRLSPHWRPKSAEEAEALFRKIGLRSPFWRMKR
jgi:Alkylmercury lyase